MKVLKLRKLKLLSSVTFVTNRRGEIICASTLEKANAPA